jgi:hypothetical protein
VESLKKIAVWNRDPLFPRCEAVLHTFSLLHLNRLTFANACKAHSLATWCRPVSLALFLNPSSVCTKLRPPASPRAQDDQQ